MVRYIGPRLRITRRLGRMPGLTKKLCKKRATPGQHGKILFARSKRTSLSDDYRKRLLEKQKVRFNYGISEKQLFAYYNAAKKLKGPTGKVLLQLLESRLDCIVYRLGFAETIPAARQLINHKHILVNAKLINIPSFLCKKNDIISVREKEKSKRLVLRVLTIIEQKRALMLKRLKNLFKRKLRKIRFLKRKGNLKLLFTFSKLRKSPIRTLLPEHLNVNLEKILGKVISKAKRSDILVRTNELKIIEYYSR